MGIDKLRLISGHPPSDPFFEWVNADRASSSFYQERDLVISFRHPLEERVKESTQCTIRSKAHLRPQFFLQLNYKAFHGHGCRHILECNPNTLTNGLADLSRLTTSIFGPTMEDLKISRIDLNAEAEIPVDYFHRALRVPYKRKSSRFDKVSVQGHLNRGITGFQIGATPSLLRVYDKREEWQKKKRDTSALPQTLKRLEWELRHKKCPVTHLSELPELLETRPFDSLEFFEAPHTYDFRNDPTDSLKRHQFNHLVGDYGAHETARILNGLRHFKRDYGQLQIDGAAVKEVLQESYLAGLDRFFANQCADPRFQ